MIQLFIVRTGEIRVIQFFFLKHPIYFGDRSYIVIPHKAHNTGKSQLSMTERSMKHWSTY